MTKYVLIFTSALLAAQETMTAPELAEMNKQRDQMKCYTLPAKDRAFCNSERERIWRVIKEQSAQLWRALEPDARTAAEERMRGQIWEAGKKDILDKLKAPLTAKFPDLPAMASQMTPENRMQAIMLNSEPGSYLIQAYVDSQNAFGAMLRSYFHCTFVTTPEQIIDGSCIARR